MLGANSVSSTRFMAYWERIGQGRTGQDRAGEKGCVRVCVGAQGLGVIGGLGRTLSAHKYCAQRRKMGILEVLMKKPENSNCGGGVGQGLVGVDVSGRTRARASAGRGLDRGLVGVR